MLVRFPGIRNLLCNIVRMTNQQTIVDQKCRVFISAVLDLEETCAADKEQDMMPSFCAKMAGQQDKLA